MVAGGIGSFGEILCNQNANKKAIKKSESIFSVLPPRHENGAVGIFDALFQVKTNRIVFRTSI